MITARALPLACRLTMLASAIALPSCVTARLHTDAELAALAQTCAAEPGEVLQEPEEKRLLFFYAEKPSRFQIHCLATWARRRKLHLVYVDAINRKN